ncbi:hypothetical protein TA3x_004038 [Tundrisphaera sp. TA3]|uniref:hypothetical protein n=1 Tax=Tundrisphaera sp. TA3 TaxID=3435775 RepID=UPI003EBED4E5
MKIPRSKLTVRRIMLAVAIVAVISGGVAWCVKMRRLLRSYLSKSAIYELRYDASPKNPSAAVRDWEYEMMMKYQHAAMFPWSHLEPDPPEPK